LLEDRRVRAALGGDPWARLEWPRLVSTAENLAIEWLSSDED